MVFATNNIGKIRELKDIFGEGNIVSLDEVGIKIDVLEDQDSFYGNASKKARELYALINNPVIADDSGLCIDALDGFPGVFTHRFLGENKTDEEINKAIIDKCRNIKDRRARVVCCLVYYDGVREVVAQGEIQGKIVKEPRGRNGFGFDSIFELEKGKTLAEIDGTVKNLCSARYLAAKELKKKLEDIKIRKIR